MGGDERVRELAEMIAGKEISEISHAQARELLETATRGLPKPSRGTVRATAAPTPAKTSPAKVKARK